MRLRDAGHRRQETEVRNEKSGIWYLRKMQRIMRYVEDRGETKEEGKRKKIQGGEAGRQEERFRKAAGGTKQEGGRRKVQEDERRIEKGKEAGRRQEEKYRKLAEG